MNNLNIGTLNVQGINKEEQKLELVKDVFNYDLDICAITETHIPENQFRDVITIQNSKYIIYSVNKDKNSHYGVGFIIKEQLNPEFTKIDDRMYCKNIK